MFIAVGMEGMQMVNILSHENLSLESINNCLRIFVVMHNVYTLNKLCLL